MERKKERYGQIRDYFKEEMISGKRKVGEQMPSVRQAAAQLAVNPSTIQRAYRELERAGFIASISGKGCFVAPPQAVPQTAEVEQQLRRIVLELLHLGKSAADIDDLVKNVLYGEKFS